MDYDYIVIGAGTAGCIMASRLSEDPAIKVLLIEAGGNHHTPIIDMPAALPFAYQSKKLGWGYLSGPELELEGRTIDEKRGRVIGGTSSINAMIFNRGNPLDFDGWAEQGLPDWDYAHCLPYFKRMETFSGGGDEWRGDKGPMFIKRCEAKHKLYDHFLKGGEQAGYVVTSDHNGYRQEGLHIAQSLIHNGLRWSTARGYLDPNVGRSNLTVLSKALVRHLAIGNGAARGVALVHRGEEKIFRAARELILCAGAFNSPQLLMLSGVGDVDRLREHGIAPKAHLPQVGRNLENHPGVNVQFATAYEDSLVSELNLFGKVRLGAEWLLLKRGLGTTNFFEAGAFLRTREDVAFPNMQFEFLALTRYLKNGKLLAAPGFQFWIDLSRPGSRGTVSLRSADPGAPPLIVFNHLQERQDLTDLVAAVRLARQLVAQPAWAKIGPKEVTPGIDCVSDADLEAFVRKNLGTSFHPSGTCRMGTDDDAVVDHEARVRGVKNLRVVDASIMPRIVTANLSATIMMMAEKISDQILQRQPLPPSAAPAYRSLH